MNTFSSFCLFSFLFLTISTTSQAQEGWFNNDCGASDPKVISFGIDGCNSNFDESMTEYIILKTGSSSYDINGEGLNVTVSCDQGGTIASAAVTAYTSNDVDVASLNSLTSCNSQFIDAMAAPINGVIPPNSFILAFNTPSTVINLYLNDLSYLCSGCKIYTIFGNNSTISLFKNGGVCTGCGCFRYIDMQFGDCNQEIVYDIQNLSIQDGDYIFNDSGTVGYANDGSCLVIPEYNESPRVKLKVLLEGAYNNGSMTTILGNTPLLLPLEIPYNNSPWNSEVVETVNTINSFPPNVVDWVLIELRDANDIYSIVGSTVGFLLSNGDIVDVSGNTGVSFCNILPSNYYVVVRHRNHLAVMSAIPIAIPNNNPYDFTSSPSMALGSNQLKKINGDYALYAGDYNADGVISVSDFNQLTTQIASTEQYLQEDGNLDRTVNIADFNIYQTNTSIIGIPAIRY